jgi:predicted RNA-binding protein
VGRTYWLDLFTGTTWEEFLAAGGEVSGFRESRWKTVQRIDPGDYLLCYLTGVSRWIGILEVVSEPFQDSTPIWKDEAFPYRVKVRPVVILTPDAAVPVFELRDQLTAFRDLSNPHAWTGHFRASLARWNATDGEAVVAAVRDAKENPVPPSCKCSQAGAAAATAQSRYPQRLDDPQPVAAGPHIDGVGALGQRPRAHVVDLGPDLTLGAFDAEPAADAASERERHRTAHYDHPVSASWESLGQREPKTTSPSTSVLRCCSNPDPSRPDPSRVTRRVTPLLESCSGTLARRRRNLRCRSAVMWRRAVRTSGSGWCSMW